MISKKVKIYVLAMASIYFMSINSSFAFTPEEEGDRDSRLKNSLSPGQNSGKLSSPGEAVVARDAQTSFCGLGVRGVPHKAMEGSRDTVGGHEQPSEWTPDLDTVRNSPKTMHYLVSSSLRKSATYPILDILMRRYGINNAEYRPAEYFNEGDFVSFLEAFRQSGRGTACISNPFKFTAAKYVDETTERAKLTGAINFIYNRGGRLIGDNLDGEAFLAGMKAERVVFRNTSMLIIGCGGCATAVAIELLSKDGAVRKFGLADIDPRNRSKLAEKLRTISLQRRVDLIIQEYDCNKLVDYADFEDPYEVVYHAAGVGKESVSDGQSPFKSGDILPSGRVIAVDANYRPQTTPCLKAFQARGDDLRNGFSHMLHSTLLHFYEITERRVSLTFAEAVRILVEESPALYQGLLPLDELDL